MTELSSTIVARKDKLDRFKQYVNQFKANFSAKNTFNFQTELAIDEDYLDFANNLDDFLITICRYTGPYFKRNG